jgi:hypothetical protein
VTGLAFPCFLKEEKRLKMDRNAGLVNEELVERIYCCVVFLIVQNSSSFGIDLKSL